MYPGYRLYTRPEGKSGGHGIGWSEVWLADFSHRNLLEIMHCSLYKMLQKMRVESYCACCEVVIKSHAFMAACAFDDVWSLRAVATAQMIVHSCSLTHTRSRSQQVGKR